MTCGFKKKKKKSFVGKHSRIPSDITQLHNENLNRSGNGLTLQSGIQCSQGCAGWDQRQLCLDWTLLESTVQSVCLTHTPFPHGPPSSLFSPFRYSSFWFSYRGPAVKKDKPWQMLAATLYLCRYLRCKPFDVAAVCSFICTRPSAPWLYFLMVLSSQLNIPKGQLPVSSLFTVLGKDLANTLTETERETACGGLYWWKVSLKWNTVSNCSKLMRKKKSKVDLKEMVSDYLVLPSLFVQ